MKMQKKLVFILFTLFLTACDNRKDMFKKTIKDSLFTFILNNKKEAELIGNVILDSAKLGKKYGLGFHIKTGQKAQILLSVSNPAKEVFIKKSVSAKGEIEFIADQIGEYRLSFSVSDTYSETEIKYVSIICFDNLPPIAILKFNAQGNLLKLDGSESYDPDAVYGGGIVQYIFTISNEQGIVWQNNQGPKVEHTLAAGSYIAHLKVKDNQKEEVWSEQVSEKINIKP